MKKIMTTITTLILAAGFILTGCKKDNIPHTCKSWPEHTCVYYDVEKCETSPKKKDQEILQDKVENLEQKGIDIKNAYIDNNGEFELCDACFCNSGKRIYGNVYNDDFDEILDEGFKKL